MTSRGDLAVGEATRSRGGFLRVAGWSYAMDAGQQGVSLVLGFLLAALLGPEAYGTVAMALVLVLFIDLFQQQGLASAIVQRRHLGERHLHSAFWMIMTVSAAAAVVSVSVAGWWARANNTPDLRLVVVALAALLPLRALGVVQEALLRRRMQFKDLTVRTVAGVMLGGLAGVGAALAGLGVWALVIQQLTGALVSVIVLWIRSDWRPRWRFSGAAARDLLGFSSGSFLSSLGVFVNNKADALVIGLFFGPLVVGVYRFGARLVETLEGLASRPVRSMALPELAPWQDQPGELAARLHRLMRLSALVSLPLLGVLAAVSGPLLGLLGPEWGPAVATTRVLCLVGAVRVIVLVDGPLLQALGRTHLQALVTWFVAAVSVATFVLGALVMRGLPVQDQAAGIAASRAVLYAAVLLAVHVLLLRVLAAIPMRRIWTAAALPLVAGATAAASGMVVEAVLPAGISFLLVVPLVVLVSGGAAGAVLCCDGSLRRAAMGVVRRLRSGGRPRVPLSDRPRAPRESLKS